MGFGVARTMKREDYVIPEGSVFDVAMFIGCHIVIGTKGAASDDLSSW